MNRNLLAVLAVSAAALAGCGIPAEPLPQGSATPASSPAAVATTVSTCDVAREALLTGGKAEIEAAMAALVADKSADATAREYAQYYIDRDKSDPDMQEMDAGIIRMSC